MKKKTMIYIGIALAIVIILFLLFTLTCVFGNCNSNVTGEATCRQMQGECRAEADSPPGSWIREPSLDASCSGENVCYIPFTR